MCVYIGIEDLAANALIEILTKTEKDFVSYKKLEAYGHEVVRILNAKNEKAVLILSRDSTCDMFRSYSHIFKELSEKNELGVKLKDGISVDNLINTFRCYLSWDVLLAFVNKDSLAKIGVN